MRLNEFDFFKQKDLDFIDLFWPKYLAFSCRQIRTHLYPLIPDLRLLEKLTIDPFLAENLP